MVADQLSISISADNSELPKVPSLRFGAGRNIALHALPAFSNFASLKSKLDRSAPLFPKPLVTNCETSGE